MTTHDILILEDEAIIAMDMEMTLESHGYTILGPCGDLKSARAALAGNRPKVALLDVNLGRGETSFPLAEELHDLGVPVVFLSGYSSGTVAVPDRLRGASRLVKPVPESELLRTIEAASASVA